MQKQRVHQPSTINTMLSLIGTETATKEELLCYSTSYTVSRLSVGCRHFTSFFQF